MLVSKKKNGIPGSNKPPLTTTRTSAVSSDAQKQVDEVRKYLMSAVPGAKLDEDFLVKVASTWSLSRKNPTVLDAAVKHLQK